jgi:hypothetical protein
MDTNQPDYPHVAAGMGLSLGPDGWASASSRFEFLNYFLIPFVYQLLIEFLESLEHIILLLGAEILHRGIEKAGVFCLYMRGIQLDQVLDTGDDLCQ